MTTQKMTMQIDFCSVGVGNQLGNFTTVVSSPKRHCLDRNCIRMSKILFFLDN